MCRMLLVPLLSTLLLDVLLLVLEGKRVLGKEARFYQALHKVDP